MHGSHAELDVAGDTLDFLPGGHALQSDASLAASADEYFPAGQAVQVPALICAVSLLYFPASHDSHCLLSFISYVPAGHIVQLSCPYADTYPSGQASQTFDPSDSVFMYVPASHAKHTDFPVAVVVKPAGHCLQVSWPSKS